MELGPAFSVSLEDLVAGWDLIRRGDHSGWFNSLDEDVVGTHGLFLQLVKTGLDSGGPVGFRGHTVMSFSSAQQQNPSQLVEVEIARCCEAWVRRWRNRIPVRGCGLGWGVLARSSWMVARRWSTGLWDVVIWGEDGSGGAW